MPNQSDERKKRQAQGTRDALRAGGKKARIHPLDDPAQMDYMFVDNVIVCRLKDEPAVSTAIHDLGLGPWPTTGNKPIDGVVTINVPNNIDLDDLCDQIDHAARVPGIVMPDHIVHITIAGCCPATEPVLAPAQPEPPVVNVRAPSGGQVNVRVIDTGRLPKVEDAHPWLADVRIKGEKEKGTVGRYAGHGTFVCGVLRALAPKAGINVDALMIFEGAVVESDLAVDLKTAVDANPDIICMSAGTTTRHDFAPIVLERVCEILDANGHTVLVAAAGNDGDNRKFYPAAFSGRFACVVSVGATDAAGKLAAYSNRGWPTVYAQGSDVVNAYPNITYTYTEGQEAGQQQVFVNGMAKWSGTSFSTPLVAGLLAAQMSKNGTPPRAAWTQLFGKASIEAFGKLLTPGAASVPP